MIKATAPSIGLQIKPSAVTETSAVSYLAIPFGRKEWHRWFGSHEPRYQLSKLRQLRNRSKS